LKPRAKRPSGGLKPPIGKSKKRGKQTELNSDFKNLLIQGDCLSACAYLKSKDIKVDLVYIDPPFASGANYAKKIYLRKGTIINKEGLENEDISVGEELLYSDIWQKEDFLNWIYERLLSIRDIMTDFSVVLFRPNFMLVSEGYPVKAHKNQWLLPTLVPPDIHCGVTHQGTPHVA
jgi:hypothetical protein